MIGIIDDRIRTQVFWNMIRILNQFILIKRNTGL